MAGESLEKIVRIWKGHDWTMPLAAAKENAFATIIKHCMGPSPMAPLPFLWALSGMATFPFPLTPFPWPHSSPLALSLGPFPLAPLPWPLFPWSLFPWPFPCMAPGPLSLGRLSMGPLNYGRERFLLAARKQ